MSSLREQTRKVTHALHRLETGLLVLLLGTMVLMAFGQIVFRNIFSFTLLWADPFLRHLVLWVGMLGAAMATREGRHIRIDFVPRLLGPRGRTAVTAFTDFFSAVICSLLFYASLKFVRDEMVYGDTVFLDIPAWAVQVILPAAFLVIAIRFLVTGLDEAARAWQGRDLITDRAVDSAGDGGAVDDGDGNREGDGR